MEKQEIATVSNSDLDQTLWLLDWLGTTKGQRTLALCKRDIENYRAIRIADISVDADNCKTSLLIGCLGTFGRKPRIAFAKEFKPGDTYVFIEELSLSSQPISISDLQNKVEEIYRSLVAKSVKSDVEWAKGVLS